MKVAVIQSNYLPWKGYFDIIHDVDLFIFYDDVQFTKNDWRNRNRIKTPAGVQWLTVPVGQSINRRICDVALPDHGWQLKHWKTLRQNYGRAPHFSRYEDYLRDVYSVRRWSRLSELNQYLIRTISHTFLGIKTQFASSDEGTSEGGRTERLVRLLKQAGAKRYISGPSAGAYIDEKLFLDSGIELAYKDYRGYPEYPQLYGRFEHAVSIVDLLFQTGDAAPEYIWGWRHKGSVNFQTNGRSCD